MTIHIILYLLTGVLSYIAITVYEGEYQDFIAFVGTVFCWPIFWLIFLLGFIQAVLDRMAYEIMRLVGKR